MVSEWKSDEDKGSDNRTVVCASREWPKRTRVSVFKEGRYD
jgi:hypothetical protein